LVILYFISARLIAHILTITSGIKTILTVTSGIRAKFNFFLELWLKDDYCQKIKYREVLPAASTLVVESSDGVHSSTQWFDCPRPHVKWSKVEFLGFVVNSFIDFGNN